MTKQDGGKLNGHHSEPAITQEYQRFSKIHESNRNILTWRSRSCLSCGVEVNAVPDDRMKNSTTGADASRKYLDFTEDKTAHT